jgi:hypothetical protein
MQTVDEKPETIHLYVVREVEPRPSLVPIVLSLFALLLLVVVGVGFPYQQPEERKTLRIPAVFLPLQSFTTSVKIIPTGIKTYPATNAVGILTLTNGSVVSQTLPPGLIFSTRRGIEVETLSSVFVPAGSATGYGIASVSAKAIVSGIQGNITALSINAVYGTSLYVRNLDNFTGGKDSYSVKVVTPQDIQIATESARISLTAQITQIKAFLAYPCKESSQIKNLAVGLLWTCQYISYSVPSYMKVTHVRLVGKNLLVDVVFVPKPHRIWVK